MRDRYCGNCEGTTEQAELGKVPAYLAVSEEAYNQELARTCYCQATACSECGAIRPLELGEDQLKAGEQKVVDTLADLFPDEEEEIRSSVKEEA